VCDGNRQEKRGRRDGGAQRVYTFRVDFCPRPINPVAN
jgi:hypothetical protein